MRKFFLALVSSAMFGAMPVTSQAVQVMVEGGQTSVLFGNGALASIGLVITGVSSEVVVPGALGPNSVAFPINARDAGAPALATTFTYDAPAFAPFAGTIEHAGSVTVADAATQTVSVEVGNFTIGFDASRSGANAAASGFFVRDNIDTGAILFDLTDPIIEAFTNSLVVAGNIAISPEFDSLLQELGLVAGSVLGADAGMALVVADSMAVPLPAVAWLFFPALGGLLLRARRRQPA